MNLKKSKKLACAALALTMAASSGLSVFAATEHWNDASVNQQAESGAWAAWKTEWETVKKDYQKVAITVGADETKLKSQDSELASSMKEKSGTDPAAASKQLIDNFEKAGGDPYTMDSVAGATVSSNTFRLMVAQILATSAVEGDTENTLEIEPFPAEL